MYTTIRVNVVFLKLMYHRLLGNAAYTFLQCILCVVCVECTLASAYYFFFYIGFESIVSAAVYSSSLVDFSCFSIGTMKRFRFFIAFLLYGSNGRFCAEFPSLMELFLSIR